MKGHCKHGEFDLAEGCAQCVAESSTTGHAPPTLASVTAEPLAETALALKPGADVEVMSYFEEAQKLLKYAESRVIATVEDVKSGTDDLSIISKLKRSMEEKRREYLAPPKAEIEAINETYKTLMEPIFMADRTTRDKILAYRQEQERQRQEAEEIARLEREAAERKAALTGEPIVVPEVVPTPPAPPDRYHTEMGTLGKMAVHRWEVVDFSLVPDQYKKIDAGKVTDVVKASKGKITIPGIKIYTEETLRVNAR